MRSQRRNNNGITHSLTPNLFNYEPNRIDYEIPQIPEKKVAPIQRKSTYINPLTQRSKKHRLAEQKSTQIQKTNRMLYEKIRKIKLKNAFLSQKKLQIPQPLQEAIFNGHQTRISKPLSLPHVSNNFSTLNSTKSELTGILENRKTFVDKYFQQLAGIRNKPNRKTDELGNFSCFGWKVKVLLLDDQHLILRGKKGKKQVSKKYIYERVKSKVQKGLEEWVNYKFELQE